MIKNDVNLIPESTATMGNHGVVYTNVERLNPEFMHVKDEFKKSILRFSYDGEIVLEITFFLNSKKPNETIYVRPKCIIDNLKWSITLGFRKTDEEYGFAGLFGGDGIAFNGYEPIPQNIYNDARNKIIEMCNPDFDWGNEYHSDAIDSIVDLLRGNGNKTIDDFFLSRWDVKITDKQKQHKQLKKGMSAALT